MSNRYEHKTFLENATTQEDVTYSAKNSDVTFTMTGYCEENNKNYDHEICYLKFDDCSDKDDKEGFLLMCSEEELKHLVNHLKMIRGI